jgi:hypothetical protein
VGIGLAEGCEKTADNPEFPSPPACVVEVHREQEMSAFPVLNKLCDPEYFSLLGAV